MASISTQKLFAKNKDNGLSKYSFKDMALVRNTISRSCRRVFVSKWLPLHLIDHKAYKKRLYEAILKQYMLIKVFVRVVWLKTLRQDLDNLSLFNAEPLKVSLP